MSPTRVHGWDMSRTFPTKTRYTVHWVEVCDTVLKTCYALHNFLLDEDGPDKSWAAKRYLGDEGHYHEDRVLHFTTHTNNPALYDTSE